METNHPTNAYEDEYGQVCPPIPQPPPQPARVSHSDARGSSHANEETTRRERHGSWTRPLDSRKTVRQTAIDFPPPEQGRPYLGLCPETTSWAGQRGTDLSLSVFLLATTGSGGERGGEGSELGCAMTARDRSTKQPPSEGFPDPRGLETWADLKSEKFYDADGSTRAAPRPRKRDAK